MASPDWRREKATRQGGVRVWKWEGGRLVMLGEKGRDGAATAGALCFAACEGYDVMLMTPHRHA